MTYKTTGEAGYIDLGRDILENGRDTEDRTGVGTRSVFGRQLRFDLTEAFPLLMSKRVFTKGVVVELLWFLRGDTNVKFLHDHDVTIWDEWMDENGDLGPVYGKQWRSWFKRDTFDASGRPDGEETIDQISNVMKSLRESPRGRRHIVSAWNPADLEEQALPPCHCLFQFYARRMTFQERYLVAKSVDVEVEENNHGPIGATSDIMREYDDAGVPVYYLDCQLYQRSADYFLGVPFNIASYALLTHMMAQQLNMVAGEFVHTFGDVHIYSNHRNQVAEQQRRWFGMPLHLPPKLALNKAASLFDYTLGDVAFPDYKPAPAIPAPVAK